MTQRDKVNEFEQGSIRVLQEERIQEKTFTKFMNSFLSKVRMEVEDLFTDLADGRKLLKLLELISGEKLPKPNNGKMRVHQVENVNKSLQFLLTKVRLDGIGAEDIVDGNPRLILGLIWTIILRFQIQEIEIDVDEENESSEKKLAKDALLLWAQRKTSGYPNVYITDFSSSWRSGLGFNALIHAHRPDLFDYDNLLNNKNIDNLNHAFNMANDERGIPSLLDAEDIDTSKPDEKSIMTYVASYYHTFAKLKNEEKSGRRIAKIIQQMADSDNMKTNYDRLTSSLLDWIHNKTVELDDRSFPNSLEGIQSLSMQFTQYRTVEKTPKYKERSEIEALYFNINTQLKELKQPMFNPADGKLVQDIERAWELLEKAEHRREVDLRNELLRQQKLEQMYFKFKQIRSLREGYLKKMLQVLSDPSYGSNFTQVDATIKKHEAISTDILEREPRINKLSQMAKNLERERFRDTEKVKKKEAEILQLWNDIRELLNKHKDNLNKMALYRDIEITSAIIMQLKSDVNSVDTGNHLTAVEELLEALALQELQINSLGQTQKKLKRQAEQLPSRNSKEQFVIKKKLEDLDKIYESLCEASRRRKTILEEARNFYQFLQDQEDEEAWLIEKQRICQTGITAKDLRGVISLQQKHKVLLDEIKARKNKYDQLGATVNSKLLINEKHPRSAEIQQDLDQIKREWEILDKLADERSKQLQDAAEAYEYYADANEADSWLNEKIAIVGSSDYGSDEPSAQALLQRHKDLEGEVKAYNEDIGRLNSQAVRLIAAGISTLDLNTQPAFTEPIDEITYEERLVPIEMEEDVPVEKIEYKIIREEKTVPQVKALYSFNDHGFLMNKGDVMILLNSNNPDWWCVRKLDGQEGFAPANYVQMIEPRTVSVPVKKPEKVKTIQRKKTTKMVKTKVPIKKIKQPNYYYGSDEPSAQALLQRHKDLEGEVKAYNEDIGRLISQADRLIAAGISTLDLNTQPAFTEPIDEITYEERMVPMEVEEDVPVEKIEYKIIREEKTVPQVKALYSFNDHGFFMNKADVMILLNSNNPDWWCVRKLDGQEGFAPANYVQMIEPRTISVPVNKPEKVKTIQRKKTTKMVKTKVPIKKIKQPNYYYGSDEPSAQALLQRHKDLESKVKAYNEDIGRLNSQADRLIAAGISPLDLNTQPAFTEPIDEITYEERMVPMEVEEDVPVEKIEYKIIREEKTVPQVKALYSFNDHGFLMNKGDVMILLNSNNPDWWCVRKLDGQEGFAPANYVHMIEPKTISVPVKKPEKVKTIQRKKTTKMVKTKVPIKKIKQPRTMQRRDDNDSVPKRQKKINDTYKQLQDLADSRHALLEDAIRLFQFYRECDDIEKWIKDNEKLLSTDDPNDDVLQAKRKYKKFVTDLSGNSKRMEELDQTVKDFEKQHHSQIDKVHARHRQIKSAWQRLNRLKANKERNLQGAL